MKKIIKVAVAIIFALLLLASCTQSTIEENNNVSTDKNIIDSGSMTPDDSNDTQTGVGGEDNTEKNTESSQSQESTKQNTEVSNEFSAYGYELQMECIRHKFGFHGEILSQRRSMYTEEQWQNLIAHLESEGKKTREYFHEHGVLPEKCYCYLPDSIEILGLSKEKFTEIWDSVAYDVESWQITQEQIDALFSGDDALIEELWCNREFAFYHNGRCYSVWDIVDSDAETLALEGVPGEEVKRLLKAHCHNPNFSVYVYNFIADNTQKELAINFGFTAEDFAAIDSGFDWVASYYEKFSKTAKEDDKAWYNDVINKLDSFEVSASLDVIDNGEVETEIIGGEVETEVIGGETEIQGGETEPVESETQTKSGEAELQGGQTEYIEGENEGAVTEGDTTDIEPSDEGTGNIDSLSVENESSTEVTQNPDMQPLTSDNEEAA